MRAARLVAGAAMLIAWCGTGWPYDRLGNRAISTWGNATCKQMTEAEERLGDTATRVYKAYIDAYVSAVNDFKPGKANFFAGMDPAARYQRVLSYCRNHPDERMVTGISDMLKVSGVQREPGARRLKP